MSDLTTEAETALERTRRADRAVFQDLIEALDRRDMALLTRRRNGHAANCACRECED